MKKGDELMTVQDVINSFREGAPEILEWKEFTRDLFQESVRITMEMNNKYHTPRRDPRNYG